MLRCPPKSAYSREIATAVKACRFSYILYISYQDHANVSPSSATFATYPESRPASRSGPSRRSYTLSLQWPPSPQKRRLFTVWCRLVLSGKSELSTANLKILKELSMKPIKLVLSFLSTSLQHNCWLRKKCLPTPMYGSVHSGTPNSSFLSPKARKKMYTSKDHKVFQDDIIIGANTVCHRCIEIYNMIIYDHDLM